MRAQSGRMDILISSMPCRVLIALLPLQRLVLPPLLRLQVRAQVRYVRLVLAHDLSLLSSEKKEKRESKKRENPVKSNKTIVHVISWGGPLPEEVFSFFLAWDAKVASFFLFFYSPMVLLLTIRVFLLGILVRSHSRCSAAQASASSLRRN
jgi:hypothetical protein